MPACDSKSQDAFLNHRAQQDRLLYQIQQLTGSLDTDQMVGNTIAR
jgi:hypothetical protein